MSYRRISRGLQGISLADIPAHLITLAQSLAVDPFKMIDAILRLQSAGYDLGTIPWTVTDPLDLQNAAALMWSCSVIQSTRGGMDANDLRLVVGTYNSTADFVAYRNSTPQQKAPAEGRGKLPTWKLPGSLIPSPLTQTEYSQEHEWERQSFFSWCSRMPGQAISITRRSVTDPETGLPAWDWRTLRLRDSFMNLRTPVEAMDTERDIVRAVLGTAFEPSDVRVANFVRGVITAHELVKSETASVPAPAPGQSARVSILLINDVTPSTRNLPMSGDDAPPPQQICYPTPQGMVCIRPGGSLPPGFPKGQKFVDGTSGGGGTSPPAKQEASAVVGVSLLGLGLLISAWLLTRSKSE